MKKISLLVVLFILNGCGGIEEWIHEDVDQEFVQRTFTPQQVAEDIDYLIDTMEARHPIFEELADVEALKALASELKSNALLPMTRRQVFNHIGQLTPLFRDGHSII